MCVLKRIKVQWSKHMKPILEGLFKSQIKTTGEIRVGPGLMCFRVQRRNKWKAQRSATLANGQARKITLIRMRKAVVVSDMLRMGSTSSMTAK